MRLLLLLLAAFGSALAAPYLIREARPDVFPAGTEVTRAYRDAQETARILLEQWRTGEDSALPPQVFEEARLWPMLAVLAVAAVWFEGFSLGALAGLLLAKVRPAVLAVLGLLFAALLYSCSHVQVTHNLSPEAVGTIRLFWALQLAAALAGFLTARGVRRITV